MNNELVRIKNGRESWLRTVDLPERSAFSWARRARGIIAEDALRDALHESWTGLTADVGARVARFVLFEEFRCLDGEMALWSPVSCMQYRDLMVAWAAFHRRARNEMDLKGRQRGFVWGEAEVHVPNVDGDGFFRRWVNLEGPRSVLAEVEEQVVKVAREMRLHSVAAHGRESGKNGGVAR